MAIVRDSLRFAVERVSTPEAKERLLAAIIDETARAPDGGGILVYCASGRRADELHARLRARGIDAVRSHGKLRLAEREEAEARFLAGEAPVLVATSDRRPEIDRPDVRAVVHWNLPASVESYAEEAARAGLDGRPARAVLLYRRDDQRRRGSSNERDGLEAMARYAQSALCRVRFLREYFGEEAGPPCGQCDNCRRPPVEAAPAIARRQRQRRRRLGPTPPIAAGEGAPVPSPIVREPRFHLGERVRHRRFGSGEVIAVEGRTVTVAFVRDGERRVLDAYLLFDEPEEAHAPEPHPPI